MGTREDMAKLLKQGKGAVAFNPNAPAAPKPAIGKITAKPVTQTAAQKAAKAKSATKTAPIVNKGLVSGGKMVTDSDAGTVIGGGTPLADAVPTPTFNPNGNLTWGGAQGLSQDAVDWLGRGADSAYFDDVNSAQRTYDGFTSDLQSQREQNAAARMKALTKLGYDQTTKRWNDQDMTTSRGQAINDMGYDFGARGLLHSSEYARQLATTNQQFQDQADAIVTGGDQFNASADAQRVNAQGDLADTKLAAIRNAVQRRAATAGALI